MSIERELARARRGWQVLGGVAAIVWLIAIAFHDKSGGLFGQNVAAWVQAVGSVAAIWAAVGIAQGEARERRQRDRDELLRRARGQRAMINAAKALVAEAAQAIDELHRVKAGLFNAATDVDRAALRVEAASASIQQFPVRYVEIGRVIDLLSAATNSLSTARTAMNFPVPTVSAINRAADSADQAYKELVELSQLPMRDLIAELAKEP